MKRRITADQQKDTIGVENTRTRGWFGGVSALLLALLLAMSIPLVTAEAGSGVEINATNFPDANFRARVLAYYSDGSGHVETGISTIDVISENIADMTGIEHFPALTTLMCEDNQLSSLDVTSNTSLLFLSCGGNQLTSLDVTSNTMLFSLNCGSNQLTTLDVTNNTALNSLSCGGNQLTSLDVSNNTALTYLSCGPNQLTALDVSKNTLLEELVCSWNEITTLDVSHNTALVELYCFNNLITSIDVSNNPLLEWLDCSYLSLTTIDVSHNPALQNLGVWACSLASLDLSNNPLISSKDKDGQYIRSLTCSQSGGLYTVDLTALPHSDLIDMTRITMTDGGLLNTATGIVTYASVPTRVTYDYDTNNPAGDTIFITVMIEISNASEYPQTGDQRPSVVFMLLLGIASGGSGLLLLLRLKQKRKMA